MKWVGGMSGSTLVYVDARALLLVPPTYKWYDLRNLSYCLLAEVLPACEPKKKKKPYYNRSGWDPWIVWWDLPKLWQDNYSQTIGIHCIAIFFLVLL